MTSRIRHLTVDCRDPYELARFWSAALGFVEDPDNPNSPGDPEALIIDPKGLHPGLLFIPVPEPKTAKNRVHLDLVPDGPRDATVDRLLALGASLVDDRREPDRGWAVLADPEGNEFCVERSLAERGSAADAGGGGDRLYPENTALPERAMLESMLDWYRDGVVAKVAGLPARVASAVPGPSATSVAGLVKHLALVEDSWFTHRFAGEAEPEPWASVDWDADPDWDFHSAVDDPLDDLVELYQRACERSRAVAARHALDDVGADTSRHEFTLRFILVHLLEETARHLGHLDILIELLTGTTGE